MGRGGRCWGCDVEVWRVFPDSREAARVGEKEVDGYWKGRGYDLSIVQHTDGIVR